MLVGVAYYAIFHFTFALFFSVWSGGMSGELLWIVFSLAHLSFALFFAVLSGCVIPMMSPLADWRSLSEALWADPADELFPTVTGGQPVAPAAEATEAAEPAAEASETAETTVEPSPPSEPEACLLYTSPSPRDS